MNIIVTGGAGFIGGNFVHYLLSKYPKYHVTCIDSLTYAGNLDTLRSALENPAFSFHKIDISDRDAIELVFKSENPDVVVNFAAESHVDRSIINPEVFLKTNVLGTAALLDASRKHGVKRFHQVSTDEVYGDLPIDRPDMKFSELSPLHTSSPYSASKASADLLVQAYSRTYGMPISISRCSNNYGPYQFPEKLIPLCIINALSDTSIPVYGKGVNVRDWLFVEDHCSAIDLIIHNGKLGQVYNIGGNTEKTNIQVVTTILTELGKDESLIKFVSDRPGHDLRYAINASKIADELGWKPNTRFVDGIRMTIDWYRNNKEWWNRILDGEYRQYYDTMYHNRN